MSRGIHAMKTVTTKLTQMGIAEAKHATPATPLSAQRANPQFMNNPTLMVMYGVVSVNVMLTRMVNDCPARTHAIHAIKTLKED